jgi:RND superfamily putative drug exporter
LLGLFGRWTWALPRWLAKVLPNIDIEGERAPYAPPTAPVPVPATAAVPVPAGARPGAAALAPAPKRPVTVPDTQPETQPPARLSSLDQLLNGQRRADPSHTEGGH